MSDLKMSSKRKFIIDTDGGVDDAQAMLMCLKASDVEVVAITTVRGNTDLPQVGINVMRLLHMAGRTEIPVYQGCEQMLMGWEKSAENNYHGSDGFGDVLTGMITSRFQQEHAATTLVTLSKKYPGEITLLALGPLTNLALAIRLDPQFGTRLSSCYIMGGNYRGEGNITPSAEFNFYSDPEAAHIVLNNLNCPITMLCWELCVENKMTWDDYKKMRQGTSPYCKFLKLIETFMLKTCGLDGFVTCDELAAACAIDKNVMIKCADVYASVELNGLLTRGQMVVDWEGVSGRASNIKLVTKLDTEAYFNMLKSLVE